jgi:hypothetical protein
MKVILREIKILIFKIIIKIFTKIQFIKIDLIHKVYFSGALDVPIKSNNDFMNTDEMFKYSIHTKKQLTSELYFRERKKIDKKIVKKINSNGNILVCSNSHNYAIFLVYFLSIISKIEEIKIKKITLLIDKKLFSLYKKDILSLFSPFGFKNYILLDLNPDTIFFFKKAHFLKKILLTIDKPSINFLYHAKLGADLLKTNVKKVKYLNAKNFFIPRNNAKRRILINQHKIKLILKSFNFKTINTENLKIEEKIKIFYKCQNLFITFGAAQASIFFCPDNLKIFGIFNETIEDIWLRGISIVKQSRLIVIRGKNLSSTDKSNNANFYLNKLHFKRELQNILN